MIKVTINGREVQLDKQVTILEAARRAGIKIPTLCHFEGLEMYGGCRLCLVEVEKMPRLQTSCTLMVTDGMVITTESEQIAAARRGMLEFILTNHPLDCPFCDKAGECELQDLVYLYGGTEGRFTEPKAKHPESNVDPILARNIERCISCTRCVRMCDGVVGASAISMINRGRHTVMEPFSGGKFDCEYCGNCLTVCPVGSILSRLYKETYRPWQVERTVRTVCGHCGVGCSYDLQVRDEAIKRVIPRIGEGLNRGLLCARGRFGYEFVGAKDRLKKPLVRRDGNLVETTWDEALGFIAAKLSEVIKTHGGEAVAGIASVRCTNEDNYVFQKFMRGVVGTNNIDSAARMGFSGAQAYLESLRGQGVSANVIAGLAKSDVIFVAGGDPTMVTPILGLEIRGAAKKGAKIISLDPAPGLEFFNPHKIVPSLFAEGAVLESLLCRAVSARGMTGELPHLEEAIRAAVSAECAGVAAQSGVPDAEIEKASATISGSQSPAFVIGPDIVQRADGNRNLFLLAALSYVTGGRIFLLSGKANEQGAVDMGCLPDTLPGGRPLAIDGFRKRHEDACGMSVPAREGLSLMEMFPAMADGRIKALYVIGENPAFNLPGGNSIKSALEKLDLLVVQDIFLTETAKMADIVLPALSWAEKDGTFTNLERRIQRVRRGVNREGREDWRILCDLAGRMGAAMEYASSEAVMSEIARVSPVHRDLHYSDIEAGAMQWPYHGEPLRGEASTVSLVTASARPTVGSGRFALLVDRPLFQSGTLTRRSKALLKLIPKATVKMNPLDAASLGISGGIVRVSSDAGSVELEAVIDSSVQMGAVKISNHFEGAGVFGLMTKPPVDPVTKAPAFEGCLVAVEPLKGDAKS
ncbi:MAG: molybdopterin-dependent oxidoreductase [Nitrospirae bacterium]|nr:molybdopterin-dependent oxidoreductase [Nitrospirota bacterium]